MRTVLSVSCCALALAAFGCGSSSSDPYNQAADEVESAVSALTQADSDDTALDDGTNGGSDAAVASDGDGDSDEATDEAAGGHMGRGDKGGGRGHGGHGRGHHHGRGHDLLLWYADLDALQTCRDVRATCQASADRSTCKDDVHACVQPILDAAFDAMCTERTAMCEAADAPEHPCERIAKHCGASAPDAG